MENAKLLYVRQTEAELGLRSLLADRDVRLANFGEALAADPAEYRVGLVLVDGLSMLPQLETLLSRDAGQQWILLVPPRLLQDEALRRLIHRCCFDYHTLPLDVQRLRVTLGHAAGMARLYQPTAQPWAEVEGSMVGASLVMQRLFRMLRRVARVDAPVLVQGESGTGKELAARAVHERSRRAGGPFVAVNCGALPASLVQSELFGHERGAFTGAAQRKIGRIEAAAGGTIFLDEIGDLPLDLQVNLLRFLQERTIERVGGTEPIPVDVRVIAATHVDLEQAIAQQRFRPDLYYRLNVLRLELPPLRQRHGDIELLADYFFRAFSGDKGPQVKGFSRKAVEAMNRHAWPGNIRELVNRVRRALVLCDRRLISPADLGLDETTEAGVETLAQVRAAAEREAVERALAHAAGNISRAASRLGVSRVTLYRLIDKHRVRNPATPPAAAARPATPALVDLRGGG